jgi:hypothetical protein
MKALLKKYPPEILEFYRYLLKPQMEPSLGLYRGSSHVLGSFMRGTTKHYLTYRPCHCKERYFLDPRGTLSRYLNEECKGFVPDGDHRYSLNYIVIVLIANWKVRNLVYREFYPTLQLRIKNDGFIHHLMDSPIWNAHYSPFYRAHDIRGNIAKRHFHLDEDVPNPLTLFYCAESFRKLLEQIIEQPLINSRKEIFINYCIKRIEF